jgi:hypothetical protein
LLDGLSGNPLVVARNIRDTRTVSLHCPALLITESIGEDEMRGIPERCRNEGQRCR